MKTVIRIGVFETNSSSTHTIMIMSKDALAADLKSVKPKMRKFGQIKTKKDKLYLACGCCYELFPTEENCLQYENWDDEQKAQYFLLKNRDDIAADMDFAEYDFSYEIAIDFIVRIYCKLTGENYDAVIKNINKKNKSGRACHMKFFEEGALYDADSDYWVIAKMFDGKISDIEDKIESYFDDNRVVCYREFWNNIGWDDDDD